MFKDFKNNSKYIIQIIPQILETYFNKKNLVIYDIRSSIDPSVLPIIPNVAVFDQRVLPLLQNTTFICSKPISKDVIDYYKSKGLLENVDIIELEHQSNVCLVDQILEDKKLLDQLRNEQYEYIIPFFPTKSLEVLGNTIGSKLLNSLSVSLQANNKVELKKFLINNGLPTLEGVITNDHDLIKAKHLEDSRYFFKVAHGVSGYGFFNNEDHTFDEILEKIKGQEIIIEKKAQIIDSPSLQFHISENEVLLLGFTDQILENGVHYNGNKYPSMRVNKKECEVMIEQAKKVLGYIYKLGYRGFGGIDFMIDSEYNVYVAEVNARFTGATPPYLISILLHKDIHKKWEYKLESTNNLKQILSNSEQFIICHGQQDDRKVHHYLQYQ